MKKKIDDEKLKKSQKTDEMRKFRCCTYAKPKKY